MLHFLLLWQVMDENKPAAKGGCNSAFYLQSYELSRCLFSNPQIITACNGVETHKPTLGYTLTTSTRTSIPKSQDLYFALPRPKNADNSFLSLVHDSVFKCGRADQAGPIYVASSWRRC